MTEIINLIGGYLSTVPEDARIWVILAFLVAAFWLLLMTGRFCLFFIKIAWFWFSGKTERRVIRHWFFGKERLAPPSGLTPFVLSYEIEREHFWQQGENGQKPECAPVCMTDSGVGTFPYFGFFKANGVGIHKPIMDDIASGKFRDQIKPYYDALKK